VVFGLTWGAGRPSWLRGFVAAWLRAEGCGMCRRGFQRGFPTHRLFPLLGQATLEATQKASRQAQFIPLAGFAGHQFHLLLPRVQDHQDWSLEDWKKVVWSDETSVILGHRRGGVRVWRTS